MKKNDILKAVSLTVSLTLLVMVILQAFVSSLPIKMVITVIGLILAIIFSLKKFRISFYTILITMIISIIISYLVPTAISAIIVTILLPMILLKKVPGTLRAVLYFIIVTAVLTWILPTTYYQYSLVSDGTKSQVGLFDLLSYPTMTLSYFSNVIVFILTVGAFYGVLNKTGVYRTLLDKIAKGAEGKELILLSIIMIMIALFTSISGAHIGMLLIVPFIISLILIMGYDKITAAMVTVGAIAVGIIGTTISSTYVADTTGYSILAQNGMGVVNSILGTNATDQMISKLFVLTLGVMLLIFNTLRYARKNKQLTTEVIEEGTLIPNTTEQPKKVWPLVLIVDLIFVIMILSQISWTSVLGVKLFENITSTITSFKVADLPIFANILGAIGAFEQWNLEHISVLLILGSGLISLIYKIKFSDFIDSIAAGAKKALKPAVLVGLIYIVLVIVNMNPITLTMVKPLVSKFNVFTSALAAFISSIFNVDLYYAASNVLPYSISVITDSGVYSIIALIWQAMYGFVALVAPTSVVLITILSYLDISYGKWLKSNWKFLLQVLGLILIALTILILI